MDGAVLDGDGDGEQKGGAVELESFEFMHDVSFFFLFATKIREWNDGREIPFFKMFQMVLQRGERMDKSWPEDDLIG